MNEFDEFIKDNLFLYEEDIKSETVILFKNNMIAFLFLHIGINKCIIQIDPRNTTANVQGYGTANKAKQWFEKSIETSKNNGWTISYRSSNILRG